MPRSLHGYRSKRDPALSNEPVGDEPEGPRAGSTWQGAFVCHLHDATHRHFDLRLEVGGVLASFAIPRGPTLDPEVKNLAVHTEDHPIEYLDFEAVIPQGTYGAGAMIVWDFGAVRYLDMAAEQGLADGKLHFSLEGRKLRGRFGLVRLKQKEGPRSGNEAREWLLIKKQDGAASGRDIASEMPRSVLSGLTVEELVEAPRVAEQVLARARSSGAQRQRVRGPDVSPMLCTLGDVPTGDGWIYELKMDGVRIVADRSGANVSLRYRSGRLATPAYPEVARAVAALAADHVVLDGEIVAFDESGRPSFERLARRIHASPRFDLHRALSEVPVVFVVFDLLAIGDASLMQLPLVTRKSLLRELLPSSGVLRVLDHLEGNGSALFDFCKQKGMEGVVSKRADSRYLPGPARSASWIKTKCVQEASFVVVGYTHGEGGRKRLGALDLASYEGEQLVYRSKVGSGLNDERVEQLRRMLDRIVAPGPTARGSYDSAPRGRVHVEPSLVVRVRFLEWSEEGALRFPVFLDLEQADPRSCTAAPHDEDHGTALGELGSVAREQPQPPPEVRVTNRDKVFWPDDGYTKGDLVDYYQAVAPTLLPYLKHRPVMLVRYPDGIAGKSFYQWNVPHGVPPWLKSVVLGKHVASAEESDHRKHVFLIDGLESLTYIANLACIPIHVLGSQVGTADQADFLTVDFDLNRSTLEVASRLALTLRGILAEAGLLGLPKTSGQTGLHVFVPMGLGVTLAAARTLADLLGRMVVDRHPTEATMERVVSKRGSKVYVDTGQTGPSRTIVAPYSVRATPGARVSTPLTWEEIEAGVDPSRFTIRTVTERIGRIGDPMAGLLTLKPDMSAVMSKLAKLLGARPV